MILFHASHPRIPLADQLNVFVDLVGLHFMKNNTVDVFSARQDLRERALDLAIHLAALLGAINEAAESAGVLRGMCFFRFGGFSCVTQ